MAENVGRLLMLCVAVLTLYFAVQLMSFVSSPEMTDIIDVNIQSKQLNM